MTHPCTQLSTRQDLCCDTCNLQAWKSHQGCSGRENSEGLVIGAYIGETDTFILLVLVLNSHKNTFAERLSPFGFDIFSALVVDLMHEFKLGVLKSVLKHLIRILYAIDRNLVSTLNERLVFLTHYSCILILITENIIADFLQYHHLGLVESAVFRRTWRRWDSESLDILKTCYRCVVLYWPLMGLNNAVLDPSLWRLVPWEAWCPHQNTSVSSFWMACPCKTSNAFRWFPRPTWPSCKEACSWDSAIPAKDLWCVQDIWTTKRSCCTA